MKVAYFIILKSRCGGGRKNKQLHSRVLLPTWWMRWPQKAVPVLLTPDPSPKVLFTGELGQCTAMHDAKPGSRNQVMLTEGKISFIKNKTFCEPSIEASLAMDLCFTSA